MPLTTLKPVGKLATLKPVIEPNEPTFRPDDLESYTKEVMNLSYEHEIPAFDVDDNYDVFDKTTYEVENNEFYVAPKLSTETLEQIRKQELTKEELTLESIKTYFGLNEKPIEIIKKDYIADPSEPPLTEQEESREIGYRERIRSFSDKDLKTVADIATAYPKEVPKWITKAIGREERVRKAMKDIESWPEGWQGAYIIYSRRTNLRNIVDFLSRKLPYEPFTQKPKGYTSIYIEASERVLQKKNQEDAFNWIRIADLPAAIGQVVAEFAALPDITSKIAAFSRLPIKAQAIISASTKFGLREAMTLPREGETFGEKAKAVAVSGAIGAAVGTAGQYIQNPFIRVPTITGGFMGMTALEGGDIDDIIAAGVTVLGFEALGLAKRGIISSKVKLGRLRMARAIKAARKHNPDLKKVPDSAIEEAIKTYKNISFWQTELKKGRVTQDTAEMRIKQSLERAKPILEAIMRQTAPQKAETPATVAKAAPQPLAEGKTKAKTPVTPTETAEVTPKREVERLNKVFIQDEIKQHNLAATKKSTSTKRIRPSKEGVDAWNKLREMGYRLKNPMMSQLGFDITPAPQAEGKPSTAKATEAKQPWEMTYEKAQSLYDRNTKASVKQAQDLLEALPTKELLNLDDARIAKGDLDAIVRQELAVRYNTLPHEYKLKTKYEQWQQLVREGKADEAMAKGEKAEKKTYTSVPKEWIKIDKLYDWGKKGLRGVRKYEPAIKVEGQRSRKTFIWRSEFADIPTRLPRETMAAFRAKTDEIFKVLNRKGEDYYLVPKQVVKEVREQLGEAAFERAPKPERTPLQRVNDLINSAKRHDLDDAEIGEAVLDSLPEMGLIEQQLSDKTKVYVKAYNDAKKSGELREDIQKGVEKEVQPTEEEAEERLAIQEEQTTSDIGDFLDGIIEEKAAPKAKSVTLPYANRKDFEQFFQYMSKAEEEALPPLVRQWKQRLVGAAGKEPIYSTGQSYRTTITPEMHTALENWAKGLLEDYSKDVGKEESAATLAAKGIIKWLNKVKFEKPRQKDLLGRAMLEGGAKGEQGEFLEKEKYKLAEPDLEGQQKIEFTEPAPKPKEGEVKEPQDREKIKVSNKLRPGFVDLTPLSKAGEQVRTIGEVGQKHITRFTGLESEVKQVLIEMEEQLRELPKVIAKESIDKFGKLTEEQERIIEDYREQPTKYDLPKELQSYYDKLEEGIEQYKNRLEELGYPADWPNTYLQRLEKQIAKEEAKDEPDIDKINNLKESLEEAKDLRYLHHYYIKDPIGKRIWGSFKRRISKKPRGVLGRKIPTYEKAEEYGLKRAPLAVSYAHMAHEIARAEQMDALIRAINENPNLSLPGDSAPDEWVYVDEKAFPASTTYSKWVDEEGKPRTKINRRKYPLPIAEALEEITYSRGNHPIERAYDKLNFGLKIIGFYNPLVMTKNDALQLWRAAGVKGALPLVMPQIDFQTLSIEPPKAIQIWMEKGAEYEKLRKGGLFNNIVSYTPAVTEITDLMLTHIRETSGEKTARIIGEWLNPKNLIKNLRRYNDASTWNMDEIMRIALWDSVKDSSILKGMTDFEKIEWCNDAMVNYGEMPKETKRWLGKGIFVPTYRISNFKFFWSEVTRVYQGQWQHIKPIVRTVAYKMFIKYGLPAIVAAAIYWKTGEERDVRTEKGYRLVIHNPETNTDTVYALSDPLLEGAKITQRTFRHTMALNLAPLPSLMIRILGEPKFKQTDDPFGEFFKLGTPLYRDIVNWRDKDKTITQKILTQLAIAFVYTRRGRTEDKESIISSLAKTLSIWTDWKEQQDDLRKMMTGKGFYTGPGGKFGRLIREFQYIQDMDRAEVDDEIDSFITKGDYEGAVRKMLETERYATKEGMSGRIMQHKAPLLYYIEVMGKKERAEFLQWLMDEKKYTEKELDDLAKALAKELE